MDIWEINKMILFLILFIPGFISIKVYDLIIPSEKRDFTKSIFEVIGYSALNFAIFSWVIAIIHSNSFPIEHELSYYILLFIIFFVGPIIWPILFLKLRTIKKIQGFITHPILKPWDYVFGKRRSYWVIVHLKDGRRIGGIYGTNSFTSSYPAKEQIYLEQVWELDNECRFLHHVERSEGIIILEHEILCVELFGNKKEKLNEKIERTR